MTSGPNSLGFDGDICARPAVSDIPDWYPKLLSDFPDLPAFVLNELVFTVP